jgi:vacuolar-type H+-ATPase catalytic subunit A/Vma1
MSTNDTARQWSSQLGELAAGTSGNNPTPDALPARLQEMLARFRERNQARQHVAEKLRALEFLHGT